MLKKLTFLISVLISILMVAPATYAQDADSTNRLRNINSFLATFIDPDNSANYLADSLQTNQCKKRDLFALHDQKDALGSLMLDEFRTLTNAELDEIKEQYALVDSELIFVRNADLEDEELLILVRNSAQSDYRSQVAEEFEFWLEKYADQLGPQGEYNTCRSSWYVVVEKWRSLSENIQDIRNEWTALRDQFNQTASEMLNTPGNLYNNTRDTIREGIDSSIQETRDNFNQAVDDIRDGLAQDSLDEEGAYLRAVDEDLSSLGDPENLATVLETEDNLTEIPSLLRQLDVEQEQNKAIAIESAVIEVNTGFTDAVSVVLWDEVLKMNETLQASNKLLETEQSGAVDLAKSIADLQCGL